LVMYMIPTIGSLSKDEILNLLLKHEYGYLPPAPDAVSVEIADCSKSFCAGKAKLYKQIFRCDIGGREFCFPVNYTQRIGKSKCFIHINFRPDVTDRYQPAEEIVDNGYSIFSFCYKDVTDDNGDFTDGLAGIVFPGGKRKPDDCGKIGLWAWAVLRVMDYAVTLPEIDSGKISVAGHSRLGKTALLAGALDSRFYCAFSNCSGCSGAAISRGSTGETIADIVGKFPYWFCENYIKYANCEEKLPFDQHFLLAANAPHRVYVASAKDDLWADPKNEFLSCRLASDYFRKLGLSVDSFEKMPQCGGKIHNGYIGYHYREGRHYFSRSDWNYYFKYLNESAEC
jgi:hypothetical protein